VSPAQLTRATRAQAANNCGEDRIAYEFVSQARPTPAYCRDTGRGNSREGGGGRAPRPTPAALHPARRRLARHSVARARGSARGTRRVRLVRGEGHVVSD